MKPITTRIPARDLRVGMRVWSTGNRQRPSRAYTIEAIQTWTIDSDGEDWSDHKVLIVQFAEIRNQNTEWELDRMVEVVAYENGVALFPINR